MSDQLTEWLFGVITRPVQTLRDVARAKPVGWAILVYLGVTALMMFVSVFTDRSYDALAEMMSGYGFTYVITLVMMSGIPFMILISLFIQIAVLQLFAKLFGGKGGYWNLFSAYAFASFPLILGVPVSFIGSFTGIFGSILSGSVSIGLSLWMLVLQVIAVRESHNISTGASIGVYILHIVLLVAIPVALFVVLISVFAVFTGG
ncbi:MAG TPA: Yip1 family protein [Candidatus Limnocylindrales bacterium]|nr:Yip1 family protein [Candidatus Limnocylindrales bacterium]